MSANKFELEAEVREVIGRGASRRLRRTDKIPAVVYGAGVEAVSLLLDHSKTHHALANEAFYSHILTLKVGSKSEKVILKDMQRHPAKPRILHIDFLRVRADQKLHMNVPLHFIGEQDAPGIKEGAIFSHLISDVEVSCLPHDLPEFISVDVSHMTVDQTLHLSDLKLPKNVDLVSLQGAEVHNLPVVSLNIPRVIEEETPVVAASDVPATEEGEAPVAAPSAETKEK